MQIYKQLDTAKAVFRKKGTRVYLCTSV